MKLKIPKGPIGDKIGMAFIKKIIPSLPHDKLYGILGMMQKNNNPNEKKEKEEILELLRKEFKKRNYKIDF